MIVLAVRSDQQLKPDSPRDGDGSIRVHFAPHGRSISEGSVSEGAVLVARECGRDLAAGSD